MSAATSAICADARDRRARRARHLLAGALLVVGAALVLDAAWIPTKAAVAQVLLARAWREARAGAPSPAPWPWADTHPVARLVDERRDVDLIVLAGGTGPTLAFGPGHVHGTALPGRDGNAVIGGHRDTHFAFLRDVERGDVLVVERPDGVRVRYVVQGAAVVDHRDTRAMSPTSTAALTLVTCWPFDAVVPGGPERYVVRAVADETVAETADVVASAAPP